MTSLHDFDGAARRGGRRRGRDRVDDGGRRNRWERGDPHEGPHEHRGHSRGRGWGRGEDFGFPGPPPFGPGGPWRGGFGPDFGPGPRGRGRGRAGRGDVRSAILSLLGEGPRNGYQIIQEIEQRTNGVWRASSGSVYPALSQLEDEGLISQTEEGGRKLFALTEAGRGHVEQNAEQLARVWQDAVGGPAGRLEELFKHQQLFGQLAMAYRQVAQVGTPAQQEEARAVLVKARQALYKILAADDDGEPSDEAPQDTV